VPLPAEPPPIVLDPVADGLDNPVFVTHAGDGSPRLYVVEQHGTVRVVENGDTQLEPFMDIDPLVGSEANEQGLLSLVFHPNFTDNRQLFVNYTNNDGDTVIARYETSPDLQLVDPSTAKIILTIDQPYRNHNGGQIQFGPDGHLYIGTGDGGSANDPAGNGQSTEVLLGKMLRINVDLGDPYAVPGDNPFVGQSARPELWAIGLRNPWRFSFDRLTGDLYIADVGQNQIEELSVEPAGSPGGLNFGWDIMEGSNCFTDRNCDQTGLVLPIAEYGRQGGHCSITGGYVYRGTEQPTLDGVYFYGDFCSGAIWGLRLGNEPVLLLETDLAISSFGEDEAGEVYVVDLRGAVYRIVAESNM
jgi:glucose/arabinose dehydrogenase